MLPQTRRKLRIFSLVSLIIGCALVVLLWFFAEPERVVQGTPIPTFWELIRTQPEITDELVWRIMDLKMSYIFFANLLRFILVMTVFTSLLTIVVVYNDISLNKK